MTSAIMTPFQLKYFVPRVKVLYGKVFQLAQVKIDIKVHA